MKKAIEELLKYKIPTYRLYIDQCYDDDKNIKQRLENANQGHLLQFYSSLNEQEKKGKLEQMKFNRVPF